jgi:hypothetical protein
MVDPGIEFSASVSNTLRISWDVSDRHANTWHINYDFKVVVNRVLNPACRLRVVYEGQNQTTREAAHVVNVISFR